MLEITRVFKSKNIRFWYDNGLHSGDDWNLIRDANGNYYVEDMDSSNGTYITEMGGNKRIESRMKVKINKGDFITVANVKIQVR